MTDYKTYLFTYNFDGASWQIPIKAKTPEEAKARLDRLHYAQYSGELVATIPVHSALARISQTIRRFLSNLIEGETVWASQKGMSEIFDIEPNTVGHHLKNIFESNELEQESVTRKFRATAADNKSYETTFYNLDAVIRVQP